MRPRWERGLVWAARLLVAGVFLEFSWGKIVDQAGFAESIYNYRMLPDAVINPIALFLPWLEFLSAIALLALAPFRRSAWFWISLMLVVFTYAKFSALQRGLDISCGCSSQAGAADPMTWKDVAFNLSLLALCGAGWVFDLRGRSRTPGF